MEVDAGAGVGGEFALEEMRDAHAEFRHFQAALDVAARVGEGFAVLAGEQFGEVGDVAVEQVHEFHQHAGAALGVGRGPRGLGVAGVFDCRAHFRL